MHRAAPHLRNGTGIFLVSFSFLPFIITVTIASSSKNTGFRSLAHHPRVEERSGAPAARRRGCGKGFAGRRAVVGRRLQELEVDLRRFASSLPTCGCRYLLFSAPPPRISRSAGEIRTHLGLPLPHRADGHHEGRAARSGPLTYCRHSSYRNRSRTPPGSNPRRRSRRRWPVCGKLRRWSGGGVIGGARHAEGSVAQQLEDSAARDDWSCKQGSRSWTSKESERDSLSREDSVGDKVAWRWLHGRDELDLAQSGKLRVLTIKATHSGLSDVSVQSPPDDGVSVTGASYSFRGATTSLTNKNLTSSKKITLLRQRFEFMECGKPCPGARGNASQVHQLVGMRGLMVDPQGQMIDLPIQSNLREGLSLTEYIISCYGARKGVVDTAVRTADAGYLTRRLVEVVQHIIVRRRDCGTIRGISVSPQNGMTEKLFAQTLIGRVLADDIYIGSRCIAARNQDIGIGLVNRFITAFRAQPFWAQPIYIRTPFTCRSTSWICQLCYGRSPTHGDLVELGEAVGIIAGQA